MARTLAIIPVFRSEPRFPLLIARFPKHLADVFVAADEPTPETLRHVKRFATHYLTNATRQGVGAAIRSGIQVALQKGYDRVIVMAGNGKDDPREIPRLLAALDRGFDYIQGSRYREGGRSENLPLFRKLFTRSYPLLWSLLLHRKLTDVTNGFRAYRTALLRDPRVHISQPWLSGYQLEYYLHYKFISLGYRFTEVPVSKVYGTGYRQTKIRLSDWWSIVGPLAYLSIGLRR